MLYCKRGGDHHVAVIYTAVPAVGVNRHRPPFITPDRPAWAAFLCPADRRGFFCACEPLRRRVSGSRGSRGYLYRRTVPRVLRRLRASWDTLHGHAAVIIHAAASPLGTSCRCERGCPPSGRRSKPVQFPADFRKISARFLKTFLQVSKTGFLFSGSAIVADDFSR